MEKLGTDSIGTLYPANLSAEIIKVEDIPNGRNIARGVVQQSCRLQNTLKN
ncbi:hypothetical protein [Microbulbifer sp. THAF38]|uniref:hypothetical protein n=1 Tax=Microbulbifer sp. THAF38 TaxID=2587856 RepID=UPI001562A41F|nr:hypothetical protein [Microbulbifer sp. THAF38]